MCAQKGKAVTTRLLLVDDEPLVTEELQEALEFEGFEVETANSVADALVLTDGKRFDVVITDLKMPVATGLDLIAALRERKDPPHVLVLSGHGADSKREEATAIGAKECFAKPVDPDDLIEKIQEVLL